MKYAPKTRIRASWYSIQSIIPSLKQHRRSIWKAPTLSYDNGPVSMGSSQTGKNAHLSAIQHITHPYQTGILTMNSSNSHVAALLCVDEAENLQRRDIRFDLNKLAKVAADSVGAAQCVSIKKYPDGMFNKAFLLSMEDGREFVAKVPNPNADIPHFTTTVAHHVTTMPYLRMG